MKETAYLRALEEGDLERTHKWHNDPNLYRTLGTAFSFVSHHAEKLWLEERCRYSEKDVNLAICITESHEHIGNIYLRSIDWIARTAEVHVFIGESEKRSLGYGSSALRQMLSHAFDTLNLRRVCLRVLSDNGRAVRLYQKLGFAVEGQLKAHVFKDGAYKDIVLMAAMRERE